MANYTRNQWKELIQEWKESGKTRQIFCQEKDVTVATFSYWRTRIEKLESVHIEMEFPRKRRHLICLETEEFDLPRKTGHGIC